MTAARPRTIVLAAGGTGGHVMPAQALAAELKARGHLVAVLTDPRGEKFRAGFGDTPFVVLPAGTFAGRRGLARLKAGIDILRGIAAAWRVLGDWNAGLVVGFGGYPSLPPMIAALIRRIPACLHEQNAILGRVNRLIAPRLRILALSFEETRGLGKADRARATVTGNPVRPDVAAVGERPYEEPAEDGPFNLLVLGGSLGAYILGEVVPQALALLPPGVKARLRVVQQARGEQQAEIEALYAREGIAALVSPFFDDVAARLAAAHLVVTRAGASTVAELASAGRPAILVPFAAAADDHQTVNAGVLGRAGGAWILPQAEFTPVELAKRLQKLITVPDRLGRAAAAARSVAQPQAAQRLADLIEPVAGNWLPRERAVA